MGWQNLFTGFFTASFVWLLMPYIVRSQLTSQSKPKRVPRWLRWLAHLSPIKQLLFNGLFVGCVAAVTNAVIQPFLGYSLSTASLLYGLGWAIGIFIVGGWHLSHGRFPFNSYEE